MKGTWQGAVAFSLSGVRGPEDCFILGRRHLPTHTKQRVPGLKGIHPLVVPVLQYCAMPLPLDGAGPSVKGKVTCQPQRTKCPPPVSTGTFVY